MSATTRATEPSHRAQGRPLRVGVVGARGFVGAELLPMLERHPALELVWVTSSSKAGEVVEPVPRLRFLEADPARALAAAEVEVLLLALPNGHSAPWVAAAGERLVVDLSTDHRFDADWVYAQPERFGHKLPGARRLSCPGCYATAAQLAIWPFLELLAAPPQVFGLSGVSGAGTAKTERNDPEVVRDNIIPYALVGHAHERELTHQLGQPVAFMPHVAPFFRGLSTTVSLSLREPRSLEQLQQQLRAAYATSKFVEVTEEAPRPRDSVLRHDVRIGGLAVDDRRVVLVSALDNLLAGAASQAMRATNLALGLDEALGLDAKA